MNHKMDQELGASVPPTMARNSPSARFLRLKEVCKVTGLGRSFIYQLQSAKRFPHSVKIGARAVGWLEDEVRKWLADRVAASRPGEPDCN
jgi:prophage regulatory protein